MRDLYFLSVLVKYSKLASKEFFIRINEKEEVILESELAFATFYPTKDLAIKNVPGIIRQVVSNKELRDSGNVSVVGISALIVLSHYSSPFGDNVTVKRDIQKTLHFLPRDKHNHDS